MNGRRMLLIVAIVIGAIGIYISAWQWGLLPRDAIATGTVQLQNGKTMETRQFYRSSRQETYKSPAAGPMTREAVWEVRLPSGRWIDCDGADCKAAAERAMN
jgi:hypothetical protein